MDEDGLDRAFAALADPVRRTIVARLSRNPATVNELAALFPITTQAVSRHIGVLEHSGLVTRTRDAQRRPVHLNPAALESLTSWLDRYRLDPSADSAPGRGARTDEPISKETQSIEREVMSNELVIEAPEGLPFLDHSREFDAPVIALFRAYTDGEIFEQWFGPEGIPLVVHRFDPRTGGGFRYVVQGADQEWGFHGVYHEIRPDELIIQTYQFEQDPAGGVSLEFQRFEELPDGRSRISVHSVSPSVASRDALDGMREGIKNDFDALEKVLAREIPVEA